MVTVPLYITIMCSTTRILMSQITFEKFLQLASSQSVQCQISTFFVWLEPRVLRLWEQWMEHKVEQNLNKTSATDLRGLWAWSWVIWFPFFAAQITPRRVPCLRSKSESEYFDSKCYYFYFLWIWIDDEWVLSPRAVSSYSLTFFQFPDLIIDR